MRTFKQISLYASGNAVVGGVDIVGGIEVVVDGATVVNGAAVVDVIAVVDEGVKVVLGLVVCGTGVVLLQSAYARDI
jgi:hypothetical protein